MAVASWVPTSQDSEFPIQNLPYGVFSTSKDPQPRLGIAIGDQILDLKAASKLHLLANTKAAKSDALQQATLNPLMELGKDAWQEVRDAVQKLLSKEDQVLQSDPSTQRIVLVPQADATMHLPAQIGDYTDFYTCEEHARNATAILRTGVRILLPNWLHLPVAYHGRASSVVISGTDIHRPRGQVLIPPKGNFLYNFYQSWFGTPQTAQQASSKLDFELEMACLVGPSTKFGEAVPIEKADDFIFGMVLMNDWSARDFQKWEMMPLGPFNGKNFATSISPWVVPLQALEPFRAEKEQVPQPLPYLRESGPRGIYNINLEVGLKPEDSEEANIAQTNYTQMHWSMGQMLAHHTFGGCPLRSGDLLGSGTVSSPGVTGGGCLLELSWGGTRDVKLKNGDTRHFLKDGDRVTLRGYCKGPGYKIGFGQCTGKILPALPV